MKLWLEFVCWFNRKAKNFAIRLVKWTGKSNEYTHPKHLIGDESHHWFIPFLVKEDRLIDLGCGDGSHTLIASDYVSEVTALDYNQRNIEIAKRRALAAKKGNVQFLIGGLEEPLKIPDNEYSAVLALDILEHLHNREQFLKEIRRILKPDGKLVLSIPNRSTRWKKLLQKYNVFSYSDLDHKHEYDKTEVLELMRQHQFEITHLDPTVYDTPWVGVIDILGGISISIYSRLSRWKREEVLKRPEETTGFRVVARKL